MKLSQPAFLIECSGVNSCRIIILRDKINSLLAYFIAMFIGPTSCFSYRKAA